MANNIKVWAVTDTDWVAAATAEEAVKCLVDTLGFDGVAELQDEYDVNAPVESLTDEEMDSLTFYDDENDPDVPSRSFREELDRRIQADEGFPQHFACCD